MTITFITGNKSKAEYLENYFNRAIDHKKLDLPELQSLDLNELVTQKAEAAFAIIGTPVLVEDVSLEFSAMNGLPGPFIKWFLESLGNDGICRMLNAYEDRGAVARISYCLYDGITFHTFEGKATGSISETPRGDTGFGWDSVFIPDGSDQTWAEMGPEGKEMTSHRRQAIEKLAEWLRLHP